MKLFAIKDLQTGKVFGETFENKQHAKIRRNELNGKSKRYVVTPGPDHQKVIDAKRKKELYEKRDMEPGAKKSAVRKRKGKK